MALLTLREVTFGHGGPPLLDGVDLSIAPGERVGLVGRNGVGKSTLLALVDGTLEPDGGRVERRAGLRVGRLRQEVPRAADGGAGRVLDVVAGGLGPEGELLAQFLRASERAEPDVDELDRLQRRLDACDGWRSQQRLDELLSRTRLEREDEFATLSAGNKRRALLARALAAEPDLLVLDEPTNHLDIPTITWLEEMLTARFAGSVLLVTHDRAFLRALATRIVELDRGRLSSYDCDYRKYLERRQAALEAEAVQQAQFDKKLSQEEAWIRQGIKARRTRNEGRVRRLEAMREERRQRRRQIGSAKLTAQKAQRSGQRVLRTEGLTFAYDGLPIVTDLTIDIMRGDRVGLIGPNGAGKTTLLQLLLGRLAPDAGTVSQGTNLQVRYFDQLREQLDPEATVLDSVAGGQQIIDWNGKRRPVLGYLQDFLFTPERAHHPVGLLSGGERNRLLLARTLLEPANLLVLDEPTNDLDCETIELLEEHLLEYPGTLLLVSHDRDFLDRVVASSLVFEGDGVVREIVGGYSDWQALRRREAEAAAASAPKKTTAAAAPRRRKGLAYKEQQELAALPARIEALESEQQALYDRMADPGFYQLPGEEIAAAQKTLAELQQTLEEVYARWESLESRA